MNEDRQEFVEIEVDEEPNDEEEWDDDEEWYDEGEDEELDMEPEWADDEEPKSRYVNEYLGFKVDDMVKVTEIYERNKDIVGKEAKIVTISYDGYENMYYANLEYESSMFNGKGYWWMPINEQHPFFVPANQFLVDLI